MTYVFGDIHGCLNGFEALLDHLSPGSDDTIITLGDYIDRGPASNGVIDRLIQLQHEVNLIALRGNHEMMMFDAKDGPPASSFWLLNGGIETLESYGYRTVQEIPDEHWAFLENLVPYYEEGEILYTHATIPHNKNPEDCDDDALFWARFGEPEFREDGRFLVCGHTPQQDHLPTLFNRHLCIDTGCVHGGQLTALEMETGHFTQATDDEDLREGELDLGL